VLHSKATKIQAKHADRVRIAECLFDLGQKLYDQAMFEPAQDVLNKAEQVQRMVIDETLKAQAEYYLEAGMPFELAEIYEATAKSVKQGASSDEAWAIYHAIGKAICSPYHEGIERRLSRADAEARKLARTLKLEDACAEAATSNRELEDNEKSDDEEVDEELE
jgi:ATP-dependent RNA circularization protein (DNA/RNA ligase family)